MVAGAFSGMAVPSYNRAEAHVEEVHYRKRAIPLEHLEGKVTSPLIPQRGEEGIGDR